MHALFLVPVQLTIYSNQISGVECNKLPTGKPYKGDFNNPMIMGTQYGTYGSFAVIVNGIPQNLISKFFVGVRKSGSTNILGYAQAQAGPTPTYVYFNANPGVNALSTNSDYEIVLGYDANGNGVFDSSEVVYEYGNQDNAAETSHQDKIVTVENDDYQDAVTYLTGWANNPLNVWENPTADQFLQTFLDSSHVPTGASATTFTLYSNDPGLKCPIGAYWAQSGSAGMATANFYAFSNGSSVATRVENSPTFMSILSSAITNSSTEVNAWLATNPGFTSKTFSPVPFNQKISFSQHELLGVFSDLNLAFGTVQMVGQTQVTVQAFGGAGGIVLMKVSYTDNFNSIYDFYYFQGVKPPHLSRSASIVQAGYGTLGNAGRVFESNVNFSGTLSLMASP